MDIQLSEKAEIWPLEALLTATGSDYSPQMVALNKPERTDEADWIARAQRSDAQAFESLYRMHIDKVYGLCLRMTGNVSEAEDCAQEAFIQAWNKLDRFRGDSAFATWLHRIAVNSVLGRMRKSKREHDRVQVATDTSYSPLTVADTGELRDLSDAVDKLPQGARHVFVLYAVYGYSHDEASNMLGIAPGTSKAQLHRARRLLAQQLEKEGFEV
jgi:RNA polymerase sigma-70 factor (ECF subfamily)